MAFLEGYRSLEIVTAFALYASRPACGDMLDVDRSWMHLGAALRMALELGIEENAACAPNTRASTSGTRENREAWVRSRAKQKLCLNLFILDRS